MSGKTFGLPSRKGFALIAGTLLLSAAAAAQQLTNDKLSLTVSPPDGSYQLASRNGPPIFTSRVGALVNHQWLRSSEYPRHQSSESTFSDELGSGRAITVTFTGRDGTPDLLYTVQLYAQLPCSTVLRSRCQTTPRKK